MLEAQGGIDALKALKACDYSCDLLLTDVVMPDISGPEIVRKTRQAGYGLPVLFMSGYTDDALAKHGFEPEEIDLLRKPFSTTELLDRIAAAIADGEDAARVTEDQRK